MASDRQPDSPPDDRRSDRPADDGAADHGAAAPSGPPRFDAAFRRQLAQLFAWRRDVRRFRTDPLPEGTLDALIREATLAPSVGYSQPWRFVTVRDPDRRAAIVANFERRNAEALSAYTGARAEAYAGLKLSGLREAPEHLAVFAAETTERGHGLGRQTMPETLRYSVVTAVYTFWLAARAEGIGVGWVSILDPEEVRRALEVPESWTLVAYLCVGYPLEEHGDPELARHGWEVRADDAEVVVRR
ncbi:5,6-dimethylbenzimidazole synthase [Rhodovibrio sodomensis]|uniref:5,6-dimethylbenzimidazole synthase n=1 Tax=Rhodovibrio sodomensis TaxID=1088 RepID=A0ABS1DCG3_9PROT|nr:5,6-dimethylbenzimidazole synthase [Rhodovibrio sodomensis]MBK1668124.1 5,6-dimethylbenzimidazole synthase [Rhodovibrio sodomensis]